MTRRLASLLCLSIAVACSNEGPTACCTTGDPALRVVNAITTPVDVLIDGAVAIQSLAAGSIDTAAAAPGGHTLVLRPTGAGGSVSQSITTTSGALSTIAVLRASNGAVASAILDDTGSVVPSGATIWQSPADASGWANAPIRIVIPLASGEKKTILMLDNPGGGIRFEVI